jgi:urea transport system substrate-binding protein
MQRRNFVKATAVTIALAAAGFITQPAVAADTIKVGILHSLSGTMAISETALKETALMAIEEINAKGGVLGKKLEPVVVDPASNWPLFAEKARQLLTQDKVAVTFGCWTSVSRKSVNPVFKELNGLLFYPVQYEGEELEKNVFYTGAAPNQQAIPAVEYLMSEGRRLGQALGPARHRLRLSAHHQQDPARLPEEQGRRRSRHHGGIHPLRP